MDILNAMFTLGPLAAAGYAFVLRPLLRKHTGTVQDGAATAGPRTFPQTTDGAPRVFATRQWLAYVNQQADTVPHVAIVGPSGSGKTTLACAILGQRPGQIVVVTAKEGDDWGGLRYVGIDDDLTYTTAERTFQALATEVKRRNLALKRGSDPGDWLTVVLDDYSTLRKVCPAADMPFLTIARIGRALRVRLLVLSDTKLVKSWGLDGEGASLGNFAFLFVRRGHRVTATVDETPYQFDTTRVPQLAQVRLSARAWPVPPPTPGAVDRLLGGLLEMAEKDMEPGGNAETDFSAVESDFPISGLPFTTAEIAKIAASIGAGHGKSAVVTAMPRYAGRKHKAYAAYYDRIMALLTE